MALDYYMFKQATVDDNRASIGGRVWPAEM